MGKYLTDTTAYISKLQENLQILSIFDLTFVLYSFFRMFPQSFVMFGGDFRSDHVTLSYVTDDVEDM